MIEVELYTQLIAGVQSVSERVYPQVMPQGCVKPALVYTIISDSDDQAVSGCVAANETRIQIDVYAESYLEAKTIKEEVKAALYDFIYYPLELSSRDGFEESTELSRQIIDFKIRR